MQQNDIQYFITKLGLEPHPEGGFYKRTFASEAVISGQKIIRDDKERKLFTSIYFLLRSQDISHFHRLKSNELWYYHGGSSLTIHVIDENGEYNEMKLGLDLENGEQPQVLVRKNTIFGSSVKEENTFSLVGCMVSPGFDFEDFELFKQEELLQTYPQHKEIIMKMAYR
ncbi:cupin domain-containing protein [Bacillus sp. Bva_UNVM-123]|uniref:cupin domain-containing protein n=1 Tax=Bacillus sp. Bva_UNVM-123 TaxID=2829798 RepID=UPI00391F7142